MAAIKILIHLLMVGLLTLFTQVGGVLWLICLPFFKKIRKKLPNPLQRWAAYALLYSFVYLLATFLIIPPLAKWQCGRVPLPIYKHPHLKPHNVFYYCILNHHYVRPELKAVAENVAKKMAERHPDAVVCYLDANFPFMDGYPLEPHFSHKDGKKLDIALHWKDAKNNQPIFGTPSLLGYGACEGPLPNEVSFDEKCRNEGNWYRNLERDYLGQLDKENFVFDEKRTKEMIQLFAAEKAIGKILLEPHLKTRLGLAAYNKIRFQGCKAARHDDHIHIQL
jgi:hypothetical protein